MTNYVDVESIKWSDMGNKLMVKGRILAVNETIYTSCVVFFLCIKPSKFSVTGQCLRKTTGYH